MISNAQFAPAFSPVPAQPFQQAPAGAPPLVRSMLYDAMFQQPTPQPSAAMQADSTGFQQHGGSTADFWQALFPGHAELVRRTVTHTAAAAALFTAGLILHNSALPARESVSKIISSDWKEWAKIALGVGTASEINKTIDWKPPAWLAAMETVAIINPLALGFKKGLPQLAVMAPLVGGVVQAASWLNHKADDVIGPWVEQKIGKRMPDWLPHLAVSLGTVALGMFAYPKIFKSIASSGVLGKVAKESAANGTALLGTAGSVCYRGCCPSVICLSELGEMIGGMRNGGQNNAN